MKFTKHEIVWQQNVSKETIGTVNSKNMFTISKAPEGYKLDYVFFNKTKLHSKKRIFTTVGEAKIKSEKLLNKKIKKEIRKLKFLTIKIEL